MNDPTVSVSKGVFVFKNGFKPSNRKSRIKCTTDKPSVFTDQLWYQAYSKLWNSVEKEIQVLNDEMYSSVLGSLINFIKKSYETHVSAIPAAALLTGINMPDHSALFHSLTKEIQKQVSPHIAKLNAEDCHSLKCMIENMISQFVNDAQFSADNEFTHEDSNNAIKKSRCTFSLLQSWYKNNVLGTTSRKNFKSARKILIIIISDFESFSDVVLQEFILILSSYLTILPFALIFGVATSTAALHKSLPYHVSSKISIQVFHSQTSTEYLNNILEKVFFSEDCPFYLGGKVFSLFTDLFLFYDLSVNSFIRNIKYAMFDHFSRGNAIALCCDTNDIKQLLNKFTHDDMEEVRHFLSFRPFVESKAPEIRIKLLTDDGYFRNVLCEEIFKLRDHIKHFLFFIKLLHILMHDLPKAPLGKQVREFYNLAVSRNITHSLEYKQCLQLLGFQSKDVFFEKLQKILNLYKESASKMKKLSDVFKKIEAFTKTVQNLDFKDHKLEEEATSNNEGEAMLSTRNRRDLREQLFKMATENKSVNKYEKLRSEFLSYISDIFQTYLVNPESLPFHEIYFFDNISIKSHIVGLQRAAVHQALNNPQSYLQCNCCTLPNNSTILRTMPDISIVYKLHLESSKMINLYDLLQSYIFIIKPDKENDERRTIEPELQARFSQAVAELEYLGFLKTSKRKADHVTRLTWGG